MLSTAIQARSWASIETVCAGSADAVELRQRIVDEIRMVVGFDAYVWVLTDPETAVGGAPLAEVPCVTELPRLVRAKYLTEVNRWTRLADGPAAAGLSAITGGDLSASFVWRDVLCRYDVVDLASLVFRDPHGWWGFLDLWRIAPAGPFDPAELAYLAGLTGPVATALRAGQAATFGEPAVSQRGEVGPSVLLLNDDLSVVGQTEATNDWLRELIPPGPGQATIPASAYNVAAQLLANEHGVDGRAASARVHLSEGFWLTLRAARLGGLSPGGCPAIAVTLEETSPLQRLALFGRCFALSAREVEVLQVLAVGADTREAARRLAVSEHTVQDHLKSIFAKTGARSRTLLLARALGASPGHPLSPPVVPDWAP